MIEKVEEYWDRRPCNIRHSTYDIELDAIRYSMSVTWRKYFVEQHIPGFAEFEKWEGKSVMDMGCGIGTDTLEFAKAGAVVFAVDISQKSLDVLAKRIQAEREYSESPLLIAAKKDNIEKVSARGFDLVYSFGVIHHTPNPIEAMKRAYEALKPGGEFRLMVYNRYSWKAFWILLKYGRGRFWKYKELIPAYSEAQTGCPITHTYTKRSITEDLESVGFQVLSTEVGHIFPYKIPEYIRYRYVKEWYWRWMPDWLFHSIEKKIGWHLLVKARKRKMYE